MARLFARLTEQKIRALTGRGYYPDGAGLYLQVRDGGVRSWVYRFAMNGRTRDAGLGSLADVSLVAARAKAAEYRALRDKGIDPIEHKPRGTGERPPCLERHFLGLAIWRTVARSVAANPGETKRP